MNSKKYLVVALAVAVVALMLFAVFFLTAPAINTLTVAGFQSATATPRATTAPSGDVIPLKPLTDLKSLNARSS